MDLFEGITSNGREKILPEPEQETRTASALSAVEKVFKCKSFLPAGTYELIIIEQELVLRKVDHKNKTERIVERFNSTDINYGLTSKHWDRLDAKLRALIKEKILCPKILKP